MLPGLYGSIWMLVQGICFSVSLAVVSSVCCSSVPRHFQMVTKVASIYASIVLCGGLGGVFLPALGNWYVGDSFVAFL